MVEESLEYALTVGGELKEYGEDLEHLCERAKGYARLHVGERVKIWRCEGWVRLPAASEFEWLCPFRVRGEPVGEKS